MINMPATTSSCPTWVAGEAHQVPTVMPGGLGEDVVPAAGELVELDDRLGQVALLDRVPPGGAVKGRVEQVARGGHEPWYRTGVRCGFTHSWLTRNGAHTRLTEPGEAS